MDIALLISNRVQLIVPLSCMPPPPSRPSLYPIMTIYTDSQHQQHSTSAKDLPTSLMISPLSSTMTWMAPSIQDIPSTRRARYQITVSHIAPLHTTHIHYSDIWRMANRSIMELLQNQKHHPRQKSIRDQVRLAPSRSFSPFPRRNRPAGNLLH